jgi:hypothetical protein
VREFLKRRGERGEGRENTVVCVDIIMVLIQRTRRKTYISPLSSLSSPL